jgi:broad specificity phosphatase PhoE
LNTPFAAVYRTSHTFVSCLCIQFDRVSTFLDSLWRSFETQKAQNYVIVTHGISIRVFLARYFRYSIDQFNMLANPKNCEMVILKHDGSGRLQLDSRCEIEFEVTDDATTGDVKQSSTRVVGYPSTVD